MYFNLKILFIFNKINLKIIESINREYYLIEIFSWSSFSITLAPIRLRWISIGLGGARRSSGHTHSRRIAHYMIQFIKLFKRKFRYSVNGWERWRIARDEVWSAATPLQMRGLISFCFCRNGQDILDLFQKEWKIFNCILLSIYLTRLGNPGQITPETYLPSWMYSIPKGKT